MPSNSPRHFIEFGPSMRVLIEDAIESLILLLDETDGDAELEDDDIAEDDPLEPDCCDHPADLGPPFTMDQSLQGAKIEASPRETFAGMRHRGAPLRDENSAPIMTSS
jgi:hypothetical protein